MLALVLLYYEEPETICKNIRSYKHIGICGNVMLTALIVHQAAPFLRNYSL